jgi:hypothetical protein
MICSGEPISGDCNTLAIATPTMLARLCVVMTTEMARDREGEMVRASSAILQPFSCDTAPAVVPADKYSHHCPSMHNFVHSCGVACQPEPSSLERRSSSASGTYTSMEFTPIGILIPTHWLAVTGREVRFLQRDPPGTSRSVGRRQMLT